MFSFGGREQMIVARSLGVCKSLSMLSMNSEGIVLEWA